MRFLVFSEFCFSILLSFSALKKSQKAFYVLTGVLLFFLCAFRDGSVLPDYDNYILYYDTKTKWVEYSFILIANFVRFYLHNVLFLFIIYAIIGITLKLYVLKELSEFLFFSVLVYIGNYYILHELIQIRVSVSTGFFLLCIKPIYERDWPKFLFFSAIAIFFHYSAVLILPLWFLKKDKLNIYIYIGIILMAYVFYFLQVDILRFIISFMPISYFREKYDTYIIFEENKRANVFNYVLLGKLLIYNILVLRHRYIMQNNKYACLLLKMYGLSFVGFVLFARLPTFSGRISGYYGVVEIIIIPMLIYIFKSKIIGKIGVIAIATANIMTNIFYVQLIR
jgi:hypothetical protein